MVIHSASAWQWIQERYLEVIYIYIYIYIYILIASYCMWQLPFSIAIFDNPMVSMASTWNTNESINIHVQRHVTSCAVA